MIQTMSHAGLSIQDAAMLERDHCMKELAHNSKTLHGSPRSGVSRLLCKRSGFVFGDGVPGKGAIPLPWPSDLEAAPVFIA
jgi:hypothetical protein